MRDRGNKIKIVYIIDFLATREGATGGTEKQLVEKIERIDKTMFEPYIFCLQEFKSLDLWDEIEVNKKILHIYSFKSLKALKQLISFAFFLYRNKIKIVETFFFDSILFGVITGKLGRVDKIITSRRDLGFWYTPSTLFKIKLLNFFTDRVLVNSGAVKKHILEKERLNSSKIDIIHNGIDFKKMVDVSACDIFQEFKSISPDDQIVGIVANFNRKVKRVDLFLKVLQEVQKYDYNVKFIIIGQGSLHKSLKALASSLGVEKNLIWAGPKAHPIPYIKCFNIGVLTSDSEGFSNSILEYMACGVPVVATDVGGNCELIEEGKSGYLVAAGDYMSLANRVRGLLDDKQLAEKMGSYGKSLIQDKYNWDVKIKEIENYYMNLVKQ